MADAFFTRAPSTIVTMAIKGQTEFTIPFEFLARKFVVVTLLGVDRKVLTMNTDYRFIAVNKIRLERPAPAGYPRIELRRVTSTTDRLVTFIDGSILRATDLNLAQVQTMHVAEEARDLTSDTIGVNDEGHLDARNRKIVNLANATDPLDAVNLGQLRQFDDSTANNADKAQVAAAAAKVSETNAKNSENRSVDASAKAVSSAGTATTAASDANNSKLAAKQSADAAKVSEANALSYSQTAKNEADRATTQAGRAKQEADKLANLNGFAQSISGVDSNRVSFNREISAPFLSTKTASDKQPFTGVLRANLAELNLTVDASGNSGFVKGVDNAPFLGYWNQAGDTYVSQVNYNLDNGNRQIKGTLEVGYGSNSTITHTSLGESSAGNWVSYTYHKWYSGGQTNGAVRGLGQDCQGLYRTISQGKTLDYWQDPATGRHSFKNSLSQDALVVHPNGDLQMQWGGLLSQQLTLRTPKRWSWVVLCTVPITNNAVLQLPHDVRGLRGLFRFNGEQSDTVYKTFTFPPLDCRFQINRKGDWQVFELANNGTTLIRRYGGGEGGDAYVFYSESPDA